MPNSYQPPCLSPEKGILGRLDRYIFPEREEDN